MNILAERMSSSVEELYLNMSNIIFVVLITPLIYKAICAHKQKNYEARRARLALNYTFDSEITFKKRNTETHLVTSTV